MNKMHLLHTNHSMVLTLRQLNKLKFQSEEIKVDNLGKNWKVSFADKRRVMLEALKYGTIRLFCLDHKTRSLKEEVDLGGCDSCGQTNTQQLAGMVAKGDCLVTISRCEVCRASFNKVWKDGTSVGQICKDNFEAFDRPIHQDSKFLVFRSGNRQFTKISWRSIETNDLNAGKTIELVTDEEFFDFNFFTVDGDKIIMAREDGSLCMATMTGDHKVIPLPTISAAGKKYQEDIGCIITIRKGRYVIASLCQGQPKSAFSLVSESCQQLSRVEVDDAADVYESELVKIGTQILVARLYGSRVYLLSVRNSKLALIQTDAAIGGKKLNIRTIHAIDDKSFVLQYSTPSKMLVVKLKV